ncbi:MAG: ParB N-terminal domain-containing protein [bacterium]|nr:ParB N-terminal domain-containing protein [bacterium]
MKLPIDDIEIGPRFRKDMGDLEGLAASIEREGLLQPIGINLAKELVFGHRRLNACRLLGWTDIFVVVVDVTSIIAGEYEENEVRKDFSVSERVEIMETIETFQHGGNRLAEQEQDFALARNTAAKKAGFGNRETARQANSVIKHGSPEKNPQHVAQLNGQETRDVIAAPLIERATAKVSAA